MLETTADTDSMLGTSHIQNPARRAEALKERRLETRI
jgi:hypothetical protein